MSEQQELTKTEIVLKENLKALRKNLPGCINKTQAAEKIGISQRYYNSLEDPKIHKQVSYVVMEKIANAYNINVSELFKQDNQKGEN